MGAELDRLTAAVADLEGQVDLAIELIGTGGGSNAAELTGLAEKLEAKAAAIRAALGTEPAVDPFA